VKYLKCDVARNIDFRINAVNKASYLAIFCGNALSSCRKVADLSILNDKVKKCRKSTQNWRSYDKFSDHLLNFRIAAGNISVASKDKPIKSAAQRTAYIIIVFGQRHQAV
jgi:hypothetical protein